MRCFIGVKLSEEVQAELRRVVGVLSRELGEVGGVKWVSEMHLTLKFLGDVSEGKLEKVREVLRNVKVGVKGIDCKLKGLGIFSPKFIRVVWAGLESEGVLELQKDVDRALEKFFEKDKKFVPHVTLGRVKFVNDKKKFIDVVESVSVEVKPVEFCVKGFELMRSVLGKDGAEHSVVEKFGGK